jgi:zinc/manganese transport system substrate-binding protein
VPRNENASHIRSRSLALLALVLSAFVVAACGPTDGGRAARGDCPTDPVKVVVTVDQWGDIARSLGGSCASVTTIITSSSGDPHDYEPTPGDSAHIEKAQLLVRNGLGYDTWANKAVDALDHPPALVDAGEVVGLHTGDNPHLWYSPQYVRDVSAAITARLGRVAPRAADYFASRQRAWQSSMQPYDAAVAQAKAVAAGRTYGATEPVFDLMADALGMVRATPEGYQRAVANGTDPSPGDVAAFERALRDRSMQLLVFNTQTEGPTPEQIRSVAKDAHDVPVLSVTETVPPGAHGFVSWQVDQLHALTAELGGRA